MESERSKLRSHFEVAVVVEPIEVVEVQLLERAQKAEVGDRLVVVLVVRTVAFAAMELAQAGQVDPAKTELPKDLVLEELAEVVVQIVESDCRDLQGLSRQTPRQAVWARAEVQGRQRL